MPNSGGMHGQVTQLPLVRRLTNLREFCRNHGNSTLARNPDISGSDVAALVDSALKGNMVALREVANFLVDAEDQLRRVGGGRG